MSVVGFAGDVKRRNPSDVFTVTRHFKTGPEELRAWEQLQGTRSGFSAILGNSRKML